jgi:hypothetical protein
MRLKGWAGVFGLCAALSSPAAASDPVVVELFTSQGCSSCPPADALAAELSTREDVIVLALHVDYWDYLGWRDVFGSAANTRRQRAYAEALGERMVYTPQMVIDGEAAVVGSRRQQALDEIAVAAATPHAVGVSMAEDGDEIVATLEPRQAGARGRVFLFIYEPPTAVAIGRGENGGRRFTFHNAVRTWMALGAFTGEARTFRAPKPQDARGVAVLVQDPTDMAVLGAGRLEFQPWASQVSAVAAEPAVASQ